MIGHYFPSFAAVREFRVNKLLDLHKQVMYTSSGTAESAFLALVALYKLYCPEMVPVSVRKRKVSLEMVPVSVRKRKVSLSLLLPSYPFACYNLVCIFVTIIFFVCMFVACF